MPPRRVSQRAAARLQEGAGALSLQTAMDVVMRYMTDNPDKVGHHNPADMIVLGAIIHTFAAREFCELHIAHNSVSDQCALSYVSQWGVPLCMSFTQ